jgi:hypothetical protein
VAAIPAPPLDLPPPPTADQPAHLTSRTTAAPSSRKACAVGPAGCSTTTGRPLSPAADRSGTMGKRTRLGRPNSRWIRSPAAIEGVQGDRGRQQKRGGVAPRAWDLR